MPHIMGDELFHSLPLTMLDEIFLQTLERLSKTWNILDKDVVPRDHDFRLFLILGWSCSALHVVCIARVRVMRGLHSCRLRLVRVILARLWLSCKRCLNDTWVLCNVAGGPGCILIQSMESIGGLGAIALLKTTVSALLISDESVTLFSGWVAAVSHILTLNELPSIIIRCLTLEHELGVRFRWADGTRPRARVNSLRTHLRRHICRVLHEISGFAQIWISTSFDSSPLISENFTCVEHLVHDLI